MKTILLFDPRFPLNHPRRLTVADEIASAAVRAGVAAAANPSEAGALAAGAPLSQADMTEVVMQHGAANTALARVFVPLSVAQVGVSLGILAAVGRQISGSVPIVTAFRAIGTRTQLPYVLSGGQANQGFGFRANPFFPLPVKRLRFLIPTFHVDTSNGNETDMPQDARFQIGVDELNTQSMSGLPTRAIVRFGGADKATYSKTSGPFSFIQSDVLELSQPRQSISIFMAKEWVGTPPDLRSPRNFNLSNVAGKYEKSELFTVASGVSPIDSGWAITQADIGAETLNSSGRLGLCPLIVAELVDGTTSVLIYGTSSAQGVGEVSGPVTDNNPYGDARGSRGWPARYIGTKLGLPYVNFGISGDQLGLNLAGSNFQRRLALAAALNPTHIHFQHGANDIVGGASVATTTTRAQQMMDKFRTVLPSVDFVPSLFQAIATGTGTAADGSDQTQSPAANANAAAYTWDDNIRNARGIWNGAYGPVGKYLETTVPTVNRTRNPNPLVSCDYTYAANGTAQYFTADLRHPNTNCQNELIIPSLPSVSPFVRRT